VTDIVDNRSRAEILAALSPAERAKIIGDVEADALEFDWSFWGRPKQHAPAGDWSNWLILLVVGLARPEPAPSGFGKTCAATHP
jgi:phage terminase large subunit-like protein